MTNPDVIAEIHRRHTAFVRFNADRDNEPRFHTHGLQGQLDRATLLDLLPAKEAELAAARERMKEICIVVKELLMAMDDEGTASLRFERMADNKSAYSKEELVAAQGAAADAICTCSVAISAIRAALAKEPDNG